MSPPRAALAVALVIFASAVSMAPPSRLREEAGPHADTPDRPEPLHANRDEVPEHGERAGRVTESQDPAPRDVRVEVTPQQDGALEVVLRRRGYLVALVDAHARAVGADWVMVRLLPRPATSPSAALGDAHAERLVWEATRPGSLETTRGTLRIVERGGTAGPRALRAEVALAMAPVTVEKHEGRGHRCRAHDGAFGGYTVLCAVDGSARNVGVANVTAERPLDDAWQSAFPKQKTTLVRMDLLPPLAGATESERVSGAEGRLLSYVVGTTGFVVRAEASWVDGETPALVFSAQGRVQPTTPFFGAALAQRNSGAPRVSTRP
jgi:hypothetical protein